MIPLQLNKMIPSEGSVREKNGILHIRQAFPLALQHVLAMILGCVTPPLILSGIAGVSQDDQVILIQASLVIAAIATAFQIFPIRKKFGSGLPVILGAGFAYLPAMISLEREYGLAAVFGAQLAGGLCAVLVGMFIKKLRILFPTLVAGIVVFTIGISLDPTAVKYMAGGATNKDYGSWQNWLVAMITLSVVLAFNFMGKGLVKTGSILFGIFCGYIVSLFFGMPDFAGISATKALSLPQPLHFGLKLELPAVLIMSILFIVNSVQAIGEFSAVTVGAFDREPLDQELQGGVTAIGTAGMIGAFFGGFPVSTYGQNVGIVTTTKATDKIIFLISSILILLAGLIPKFSAVIMTIPECVLGGATISVFAIIAMNGLRLIFQKPLTFRNSMIVGISVALGIGITSAPGSLAGFPGWVNTMFGESPIVAATLTAVCLNLVLPEKQIK